MCSLILLIIAKLKGNPLPQHHPTGTGGQRLDYKDIVTDTS